MKVCFFGSYVPGHINSILKKKLELKNVEVVECQEDVHRNIGSVIKAYWNLFFKHRKLSYDVMIIPLWRGAIALPLAKLISRKPILYYAYVSPYDTFVNDRKSIKENSFKARMLYIFEKMSWRFSDLIVKESDAEINYYTKQFGIDKKKFRKLFVSSDESKFPPCEFKTSEKIFYVLFFGKFIPLHGVEIIIEAAKILMNHSDIIFKFCGDGQTKKEMEDLARNYQLKNIQFLGFVPDDVLQKNINESDVCLGIFGKSKKASYVITNKVYQILSSQKPLITMDSNVIKEIHAESGKNCILVPRNPQKLADAIIYLKENANKRKEIALAGHKLYEEQLSMKKTGVQILEYLNELIQSKKK